MVDIVVRLVVDTWTNAMGHRRIADDELDKLTTGNWHYGTTFTGTIKLSGNDAREMIDACERGYVPVVWAYCAPEDVGE